MLNISVSSTPSAHRGIAKTAIHKEQSFLFDAELMREYQEYQRVNVDIHIMITMTVVGIVFYIGRCNISRSPL